MFLHFKVYDSTSENKSPRSAFCKMHPPAIISNGHAFTMEVPSIVSELEGVYTLLDSFCGDDYNSLNGKFSSPFYPSSYAVNMNCEWYITTSRGNSIVLTIESIDLEDSEDCNKDYIEIRENDARGRVLGIFCGRDLPIPVTSSNLWIKFNSDNDIVGSGFLASYNYATHNEINGTSGFVESPRYPSSFHSTEPYSWRITVEKEYVIYLQIKHIVDVDVPFIKIYDGYSDIGGPIDYSNSHLVRSNTNILYITSQRGPFQFEWERVDEEEVVTNRANEKNIEICGQSLVYIKNLTYFSSPGYPNGYATNLNCTWTFVPENPSEHIVLNFVDINLEKSVGEECLMDYITLWNRTNTNKLNYMNQICEKPASAQRYEGQPSLKLEFVSDDSINGTGFSATLDTDCGSEMTLPRAFVNITTFISKKQYFNAECIWTIQVKQSRRVRITFIESQIKGPRRSDTDCSNFFIVRNGISSDSPFLGQGKYCNNNITDVLETTGNHAYIKLKYNYFVQMRAAFHYEEIGHQCSDEIVLSEDFDMDREKTITSPNYPNLPNPHSECFWIVKAPRQHVIAVNFVGKFDLAKTRGPMNQTCSREYLQLNDGATELMPLIGEYCGSKKPDFITTTSNILRIKYFTDIAEPHSGFMLNVSIAKCGGSYHSKENTIYSPTDLNMRLDNNYLECVYTIELERGSSIELSINKLQLPHAYNCTDVTHLEVQEIDMYSDVENVTDTLTICGDLNYGPKKFIVETNKIIIRYKIKGKNTIDNMFEIKYTGQGSRCGRTLVASRGVLQTPGYPGGVKRLYKCSWSLQAPKGKRIKIEFLDFDTGNGGFVVNNSSRYISRFSNGYLRFANDFNMKSIIARISDKPPTFLYSSDNTMGIEATLFPFRKHRGFKLRFSSDEDSPYCNHHFNLKYRKNELHEIVFKSQNDIGTGLYCSYNLAVPENTTLALYFKSFDLNYKVYDHSRTCNFKSPIRLTLDNKALLPNLLCNNDTQPIVRLPFPIAFQLFGDNTNELTLQYQLFECGGIIRNTEDSISITQPEMSVNYTGRLECAWALWPDDVDSEGEDNKFDAQFEISIQVDFKDTCERQYLLVYNGPNQNSPLYGRYCTQSTVPNLLIEHGLFVEYFSQNYENISTFNITTKQGSGCGGKLTYPFRKIFFEKQYQNNVECIWDIVTQPGYHIGLHFIERFFIESSKDCTKDYLKVQQIDLNDNWVDIMKVCGREPPQYLNTTSTQMRLIFRSDGDTTGDGFTAVFQRNCGGILYATNEMQEMVSPGYPKFYEKNTFCSFTIFPSDPYAIGIQVRFLDFDLESSYFNDCNFDNVTVIRNSGVAVNTTVLCGLTQLREYRATESIQIVLRSDDVISGRGFKFQYTINTCGGLVTKPTIIESPKDENNKLSHLSRCYWNITAADAQKIVLKFEELDFEEDYECSFDGIEIFKGLVALESDRFAKLCGNFSGNMPILSIPSNKALIYSYSDDSYLSHGFKALVSFAPNCDKNIFLDVNNSTYDLNMFNTDNKHCFDCNFAFKTTAGRQILIEFVRFQLEETINCADEYFEVHDGLGPFADEIGRFCGNIIPKGVMSVNKALFVRFVKRHNATGSGFQAQFKSVPLICGQQEIELKGNNKITLKAPVNSDGVYLNNMNCFWKIKSAHFIMLKFEKMDISAPATTNRSCGGDFIKIYTSEDSSISEIDYGNGAILNGIPGSTYFATKHIFCGSILPADYFTSTNEVFVNFKTDDTGAKSGFTLTASGVDTCDRNYTSLQGRIIFTEDLVGTCNVYISSPTNYSISLYYGSGTYLGYSCNESYIEVFDSRTNQFLQKSCDVEMGSNLFTNTNELHMIFHMSEMYKHLDITFLASRDGPGCGGDLYNTAGIITSPFYPNNVRNNSDCRWNIRVPSNVHVLLDIDVFDFGARITCHSDYLQIIEHSEQDGQEHVKRQFCGDDRPTEYRSDKNYVSLRFHKTANFDGTGFVIRFSGIYANSKNTNQ